MAMVDSPQAAMALTVTARLLLVGARLRGGSWKRGGRLGASSSTFLLYLDLTMSPLAQRLAMSRLAPVQATSHGHPVTSGLPPSVMQHFISWGAAELPLAQAQEHYTERLALLPANSMHQYYQPRAPGGVSIIDGQSFAQLRRSDFAPLPRAETPRGACPGGSMVPLHAEAFQAAASIRFGARRH